MQVLQMQRLCHFRDAVLIRRGHIYYFVEETLPLKGCAALTLLTRRNFDLAEETRPLEGRVFVKRESRVLSALPHVWQS